MKASKGATRSCGAILGVLSDSHGQAARTRRAVDLLVERGATTLIHCGDLETLACVDPLAGLDAHLVSGNCDDSHALAEYAQSLGVLMHGAFGTLIHADSTIAFGHGHRDDLGQAVAAVRPRWLFHGHTHLRKYQRGDGINVVNPGALSDPRPAGARPSVALVNLDSESVEFIEID
jgi:putative phosphoesterase